MEISNRIALDYYEELLPEIEYVKEGSFLEELDELNVGVRLRDTLSSVLLTPYCHDAVQIWNCGKTSWDLNTSATLIR